MDKYTTGRLKDTKLFAGIREEDIPRVLGCIDATERSYSKGEYIYMEGDDIKQVGLVIGGSAQIIKEDVWGDKMILAMVCVGEVFGESFVCNSDVASTVSVLATADCRILLLPFRRLLTACGHACQFHQQLIENMVNIIAEKNVQLMKKMEMLSKKTMRERILVWLSQQAQAAGASRFTSPMGRLALAEYLCVDRSALTRELTNMKKAGLIDFERNSFILKSIEE